jgi:hypothetical protein
MGSSRCGVLIFRSSRGGTIFRGRAPMLGRWRVFGKPYGKVEAVTVVKNFLWKMGNNLLHTKGNLVKKYIVSSPECPICLQGTEDIFHIILSCRSAMVVWQECGKNIQKLVVGELDGR